MEKMLTGTSSKPVLAETIIAVVTEMAMALYGPLPGIKIAAENIAQELLGATAATPYHYNILLKLDNKGKEWYQRGYCFAVYTPPPSWSKTDRRGHEVWGTCGCPFDAHVRQGFFGKPQSP